LVPIVSIVVPSYRSQKRIFTALDSFVNQETTYPYEIIVVDSTPGDLHVALKEKYPTIKVIHKEEQMFPGVARNIGIKEAAGEIILFLDADVVVEKDLINSIVQEINRGHDVVTGAIEVANPLNIIGWGQYLFEFNEFMPEWPQGLRTNLATYCVGMKKALFDTIGYFHSERFWAEDVLFSVQLNRHNIPIYFKSDLIIRHFNKENLWSILKTQYYLGWGGIHVRKTYHLPGNFILKFPVLLIPLGGVYKFFSIFLRLLKHSPKKGILYVLLSPLIVIILISYMSGMWKGSFEKVQLVNNNTV
jgi:glycosyltransferase involved in cell wall biosynthesis